MNYTNTTTYTCATNEQGTRYERTTRIESNKPLTATGAQRKLRASTGDKSIVVTRIEAMSYSS